MQCIQNIWVCVCVLQSHGEIKLIQKFTGLTYQPPPPLFAITFTLSCQFLLAYLTTQNENMLACDSLCH